MFTILLLTWCSRMYGDISNSIHSGSSSGSSSSKSQPQSPNTTIAAATGTSTGKDRVLQLLEYIDVNILIMHLRLVYV